MNRSLVSSVLDGSEESERIFIYGNFYLQFAHDYCGEVFK